MILGIDASNIRAGGGITHLAEVLRSADPPASGFTQVIVWGGTSTLGRLPDRPWLRKDCVDLLDRTLPYRLYWQKIGLGRMVQREKCDLLFAPGGSYSGSFRPFVSMSQNLLPFEWSEARRYGGSWQLLRNILLRFSQIKSFRAANGVIFLTEYARDAVLKSMKAADGRRLIIPHGINVDFFLPPRPQRALADASDKDPFRILYVSIVDVYKHQWHVAEAVARLRKEGLPVRIEFVGPAFPPALNRLNASLRRLDPHGAFLKYVGPVPYEELSNLYRRAELFVFASSCETFGLILTEAMAAGLPITCSNQSSLRETLGDTGLYFDPEKPVEIAEAIRTLLESPVLRMEKADAAYRLATTFTWERCAEQTFQFLAQNAADGP